MCPPLWEGRPRPLEFPERLRGRSLHRPPLGEMLGAVLGVSEACRKCFLVAGDALQGRPAVLGADKGAARG